MMDSANGIRELLEFREFQFVFVYFLRNFSKANAQPIDGRLTDIQAQFMSLLESIHSYDDILPQRFLLFWLGSNHLIIGQMA